MREIKFRVYNPRDNKMHFDITGFEFIDDCEMSGVFIDGAFFSKEEIELMQYTALKDKNGKEIYEGDIVNFKMYDGQYENYQIIFRAGEFNAINKDDTNYISVDIWNIYGEVIGNIYENPELLEDK